MFEFDLDWGLGYPKYTDHITFAEFLELRGDYLSTSDVVRASMRASYLYKKVKGCRPPRITRGLTRVRGYNPKEDKNILEGALHYVNPRRFPVVPEPSR